MHYLFTIVTLLFSATATYGAMERELTLDHMEVSQRKEYRTCTKSFFNGNRCQELRSIACSSDKNTKKLFCLTSGYDECLDVAFQGNVNGLDCPKKLKEICEVTGDQYTRHCDVLRYEQCRSQDFVGEILVKADDKGRRDKDKLRSCVEVRQNIISSTIKNRYLNRIESHQFSRPWRLEPDGGIDSYWQKELCDKSKGDRTSNLYQYCKSDNSSSLNLALRNCTIHKDLPAIVIRQFFELIESKNPRGSTAPKRDSPECLKQYYERLLRLDEDGRPISLNDGKLWSQLDALFHFIEMEDHRDDEVRLGAAKVLSRFSGDSVLETFHLNRLAMSLDDDLKIAGLEGLAQRSYQSGLSMLLAIQGIYDSNDLVKAAAIRTLGNRWAREYRGRYIEEFPAQDLGFFGCPEKLDQAAVLSFQNGDLEELKEMAKNPDDYFCYLKVGIDLRRSRNKIITYVSPYLSANDTQVRIASMETLAKIAAKSDKNEIYQLIAKRGMASRDAAVRVATLRVLVSMKEQYAKDEGLLKLLMAEVKKGLHPNSRYSFSLLHELLGAVSYHVFDGARSIPEMTRERERLPYFLLKCLEGYSDDLEMIKFCASASIDYVGSGTRDYEIENALFPILKDLLLSSNEGDLDWASSFVRTSYMFSQDRDLTLKKNDKSLLIKELTDKIKSILESKLSSDGHLLAKYMKLYRSLDKEKYEALIDDLAKKVEIVTFIKSILDKNKPRIDIGDWMSRYSETKKDVVSIQLRNLEVNGKSKVVKTFTLEEKFIFQERPDGMKEADLEDEIMKGFASCREESHGFGICQRYPEDLQSHCKNDTDICPLPPQLAEPGSIKWKRAKRSSTELIPRLFPLVGQELKKILAQSRKEEEVNDEVYFWGFEPKEDK